MSVLFLDTMLDTTADVPVMAVQAVLKATAPTSHVRKTTFTTKEAVKNVTSSNRLAVRNIINPKFLPLIYAPNAIQMLLNYDILFYVISSSISGFFRFKKSIKIYECITTLTTHFVDKNAKDLSFPIIKFN